MQVFPVSERQPSRSLDQPSITTNGVYFISYQDEHLNINKTQYELCLKEKIFLYTHKTFFLSIYNFKDVPMVKKSVVT